MKKLLKFALEGILFSVLCLQGLWAEDSFSWDFENVPVKDILYMVSIDTGISIFSDDTVDGNGDLKFAGKDFESAFDSFLLKSRLYVEKSDGLWIVSRFKFEEKNGLFSLDAYDLTASQILEKLSMKMEKVFLFDSLPGQKLSVHFKELSADVLMESLASRFGNFTVVKGNDSYQFCKKVEQKKLETGGGYVRFEREENGLCKVDVKDSRFSDVIEQLFLSYGDENYEFCWLCDSDVLVRRSVFSAGNFDELLGKICGQNGYDFVLNDCVYYLVNDSGSKREILDGKRNWNRFDLKFSDAKDILPVVLTRFGKLESFLVSDKAFFFAKTTAKETEEICEMVKELDLKEDIHVINLKYVKPSDFLERLPSFVDKERLYVADNNSALYYRGTENAFEAIKEQILVFDQPVSRISYDLLILQNDETKQSEWSLNFSGEPLALGDRTSLVSQLGNVMSLNLNVLSTFGLKFAQSLQCSLEKNRTSVFADTTLHGTSGKEISFQSTSTYRYRDNNLDPDTGKPVYSGVTKEISSGIKIEITGWVSGNGMITTSVTASVSRQGTDTSASTGNPPPTTEKLVTTEVCGKSGEPVVLSGLTQNSISEDKNVPFGKSKTKEKGQLVIYLIPRIENGESLAMKKSVGKVEREKILSEIQEAEKML